MQLYFKDYVKQYGSTGFVKSVEQRPVDMEGILVEINSPAFSNDKIDKILKENNFGGLTFITEDGKIMVDSYYVSAKSFPMLRYYLKKR